MWRHRAAEQHLHVSCQERRLSVWWAYFHVFARVCNDRKIILRSAAEAFNSMSRSLIDTYQSSVRDCAMFRVTDPAVRGGAAAYWPQRW